jgi:hypothetical protein
VKEPLKLDDVRREPFVYQIDAEIGYEEVSVVIIVKTVKCDIDILKFGEDLLLDLEEVRKRKDVEYIPDFFDIFEFLECRLADCELVDAHCDLGILFKIN